MKMYILEKGGIAINRDYIGQLYIELKKPIFILCLSLVNDYHIAEDILQETFVKVINNTDKFLNGSNAKAWIYTIARNTSLNYLKNKNREVIKQDIVVCDDRCDNEEVLSSMEFLRLIEPLSLEEKQIVALRLSCNLGYFQISKILNISVINLRKKYSRAINKLKNISR